MRSGRLACVLALACIGGSSRLGEEAERDAARSPAAAVAVVAPPASLAQAGSGGTNAADAHAIRHVLERRRDAMHASQRVNTAKGTPGAAVRIAASRTGNTPATDVQDYFLTETAGPGKPQRAVDAGMVGFALESPDFADIVGLLAGQSAGDDLLLRVNDFYRDGILAQLAATEGGMRLEHLACGVTLCIGEIAASRDNDEWLAWEERFDEDPNMKPADFSEYSFDDPADPIIRHRFLFFIDPTINVAVVRY